MMSKKANVAGSLYHKASRDGNVFLLLEGSKRDFFKRDEFGMLPIHWAAKDGRVESARVILGCAPETAHMRVHNSCEGLSKCQAGFTPLHLAAINGHLDCVSYLLNFGCNLWSIATDDSMRIENEGAFDHEEAKRRHRTALDLAAAAGHSNVVRCIDHFAAVELGSRRSDQMKKAAQQEFEKLTTATSTLGNNSFFKFRIQTKDEDAGNKQQVSHRKIPNDILGRFPETECLESVLHEQNISRTMELMPKYQVWMQKLLKFIKMDDRNATNDQDERNYKPPGIIVGTYSFDLPVSKFKSDAKSPTTCSKTWQWSKSFESGIAIDSCWRTINSSGKPASQRGIFERPGFGSVTFRSLDMSSIFPRVNTEIFENSNIEDIADFDAY